MDMVTGVLGSALALLALSDTTAVDQPAPPQLSEAELGFLCALPREFKAYQHVTNLPTNADEFAAAAQRRRTIDVRTLPPAITCGGGQRVLSQRSEFINGLGFSPDGLLAMVSGGYQVGPLNGQGGECYFTLKEGRWSSLGCRATWVS